MANSKLSPEERAFYARHLSLPQVGMSGQEKLKGSSVLLIGLGGLGSPLALYLAAAGVGRLGIFEFDRIETSNLQRQILYGSTQEGRDKLQVGSARLRDLNPHIQIVEYPRAVDVNNARATVREYDVVADGADNFATRFLVNDACVLENKPLVSASILGFEGQLSVFHHAGGPCYRCLYPQPPPPEMAPSCTEAGVLGVLPGVMGTLQATEVLKILLGIGEVASSKLVTYEALSGTFQNLKIRRDPKCPICGDHPTIKDVAALDTQCEIPIQEISAEELERDFKNYLVIDVRERHERELEQIPFTEHHPLNEILTGAVDLPRDRRIVLHCASGKRSLRAAQHLAAKGYDKVLNLRGGIQAWLARKPISRR